MDYQIMIFRNATVKLNEELGVTYISIPLGDGALGIIAAHKNFIRLYEVSTFGSEERLIGEYNSVTNALIAAVNLT